VNVDASGCSMLLATTKKMVGSFFLLVCSLLGATSSMLEIPVCQAVVNQFFYQQPFQLRSDTWLWNMHFCPVCVASFKPSGKSHPQLTHSSTMQILMGMIRPSVINPLMCRTATSYLFQCLLCY